MANRTSRLGKNPKPLSAVKNRGQPQFGRGVNEGIQYEIFCDKRFYSVRVVECASLKYHGAWMFDGGARELLSSLVPLSRSAKPHLDLIGDNIHIEADDAGGSIKLETSGGDMLAIDFKSPITASWGIPPRDSVIHQPLLQATVSFGGRTVEGHGYCKRYWYAKDIDYWNWRFIMGVVRRRRAPAMVWTAEANFALEKYDYFKIATPDGTIVAADKFDSCHRETQAFGIFDGVACEARVRELGRLEKVLRSDAMETKLSQRFCELTLVEGRKISKGYALHEIGAGTAR